MGYVEELEQFLELAPAGQGMVAGLETFIESDTGHLFGVLHRNAWARYSDITVLLDRAGISSDLCEVVLRGFVRDSTKAVSLMRDELWRLDGVRAAKMEKE